jgi:tetratricopeptide (TPR) repeat protein
LQVLAQVEELFGPSNALCRQRQELARALGLNDVAEQAGKQAAELPPHTVWDHYTLGRRLLQAGDLDPALESLRRAVDLQPHSFWPNWYLGLAAHRRERFAEAFAAFGVCVALAPDDAGSHYNRALVLAAQDKKWRALRGYSRALELNPGMAAAALNRGLLRLELGQPREAVADFERALANGGEPAGVHYALARAHLACNDRRAALAALRQVLSIDANHAHARALLGQLTAAP